MPRSGLSVHVCFTRGEAEAARAALQEKVAHLPRRGWGEPAPEIDGLDAAALDKLERAIENKPRKSTPPHGPAKGRCDVVVGRRLYGE